MNITIDLNTVSYKALNCMNQEYVITDEQYEAALTAMAVKDAERYRSDIKPEHLTNIGADSWGEPNCNLSDLAAETCDYGEMDCDDWNIYRDAFTARCKQMLLTTA